MAWYKGQRFSSVTLQNNDDKFYAKNSFISVIKDKLSQDSAENNLLLIINV